MNTFLGRKYRGYRIENKILFESLKVFFGHLEMGRLEVHLEEVKSMGLASCDDTCP